MRKHFVWEIPVLKVRGCIQLGKYVLLLLICLLITEASIAQKHIPSPVGKFQQKSTKLGEPIQYTLVLKHPSNLEFYFPDSTHDFSPFEYLSRSYFPTQTDSLGNSYDSIIYSIATFELGAIQTLSVPVYLKGAKNPRPIYPEKDSIQLIEVIQDMPDDVRLFENTTAAIIQKEFNYPIVISLTIAFLLTCLFVYLVFGGNIRNYFLLKKMGKTHFSFLLAFDHYIYEGTKEDIGPAISLWKNYSGRLLNIPFMSYTTKEIGRTLPNETAVMEALRLADVAIYAGKVEEGAKKKLLALKEFSQKTYEEESQKIQQDSGDATTLPPFFKWLPVVSDQRGHMALYSFFSILSYLIVIVINKKADLIGFTSTLLFPFIAFLLTNYLSILAYREKVNANLTFKDNLVQLYGQASITGLGAGIGLLIMALAYPNDYLFITTISSIKVAVMIIFPVLKIAFASILLPLYYYIFHKKNAS